MDEPMLVMDLLKSHFAGYTIALREARKSFENFPTVGYA